MVAKDKDDLLGPFLEWAELRSSIAAVVLFGSRARESVAVSDRWSDVDLQVITSRPNDIIDRSWTAIYNRQLWAFATRTASGGVKKVTAVFRPGDEIDIVVVPRIKLQLALVAVRLGLHRNYRLVSNGLNELSTVMRHGYRVVKGGKSWTEFYRRVVTEVAGTRLNDEEVRALAEEFVCDFVWCKQKLERGELIAVQRVLHRSMGEINIRLLHELKLRRGERTFREARRAEQILTSEERNQISVQTLLDPNSLTVATEKSASTCRHFVRSLVGCTWQWPPLD